MKAWVVLLAVCGVSYLAMRHLSTFTTIFFYGIETRSLDKFTANQYRLPWVTFLCFAWPSVAFVPALLTAPMLALRRFRGDRLKIGLLFVASAWTCALFIVSVLPFMDTHSILQPSPSHFGVPEDRVIRFVR